MINISTRGRSCLGRWYPRPDRISIFINNIAAISDPNKDIEGFISLFVQVEFHELGHVIGFRGGCAPSSRCKNGLCYWCNLTFNLKIYNP